MAEKTAKKPNIIKRIAKGISRFFRDTIGEMKKVVWPSAKQVRNNLIIVLVFVAFFAALILLLDYAFGFLLKFVLDSSAKLSEGDAASTSQAVAAALLPLRTFFSAL